MYSKVNQLYVYIYPLFFGFPSHLGHQRALCRVPCAILQVLVSYLFYTQYQQCIYVNPNLSIHSPHLPPWYPYVFFCLFVYFNRNLFLLFIYLFILFIDFWLCWVFVAACGLSLVAASGGYSLLWCTGFSLQWLLLLWSTGSRHTGFSSCSTRAQQLWLTGSRAEAQQLWHTGLVVPQHVGSSRTRAQTRVPCIGRRILNHCATISGKSGIHTFVL